MNRLMLMAPLVLVAALASGCPGDVECDYVPPVAPTGNTVADLKGCWHGPGYYELAQDGYGLVVYQFTDTVIGTDGTLTYYDFREVQPPNAIYAGGNEFPSAYVISGDSPPLLSINNFPEADVMFPAAVEITETSLNLVWDPSNQVYGAFPQTLRRAVCRGFGFDQPEQQCFNPTAP